MKIQLKCPKMPSIESRVYEYEIPPVKDDILIIDGANFIVLCRQYDNTQNYISMVLVIEPIDVSSTY